MSNPETDSVMVVSEGREKGGMGSCLVGTEFQFGKMDGGDDCGTM